MKTQEQKMEILKSEMERITKSAKERVLQNSKMKLPKVKTQEQKIEIFKLEIERITKSAKESIAKFKNEVAKSEAGVVGTAIFWYGNDAMIGEYILKELLPINIALGLLEDRNTTFDYFITQIEKEIERLRNDYYYPSSSGFAQEARNYAEYIAKFELAKKLREALSYIQKD